jgi:hypothetical protein
LRLLACSAFAGRRILPPTPKRVQIPDGGGPFVKVGDDEFNVGPGEIVFGPAAFRMLSGGSCRELAAF